MNFARGFVTSTARSAGNRGRTGWGVTFCAVATLLAAVGAGQGKPEVRAHIDALIGAISSGSPAAFEAMAREHFAPALLAARPADERGRMVQRIHEEFGQLTVERVESDGPGTVTATAKGSKGGTLRFALALEPSAPFRIARMAVEAGEGADERGGLPPPPIDRTMSAEALAKALDGYLDGLSAHDDFAGVVLLARNGTAILEKAYGEADRDRHTPMTADLRFNIASIGKAFTKVAVGQLIAQGKLSLSDTIAARLPDYPNATSRTATIDQLLHHTAGIADFFGPHFTTTPKERFQSNADYYRFVSGEAPLFAPGARNQYCNGCYVVLGEIIARASGVPYEQYVAEHVFKPAGMTGAAFAAYGDPKVAPGYTREGAASGTLVSNISMHGHHGSAAGGAYASAADLLAFDNALREGRLLDAKMTGWYFEEPPLTVGRVAHAMGIAGGAPGANAVLEGDGTWTIVVVGNLDPPNAMRVGSAIRRQLEGRGVSRES
jgi:CubicO group peptidase (beta-lactamase class C family)